MYEIDTHTMSLGHSAIQMKLDCEIGDFHRSFSREDTEFKMPLRLERYLLHDSPLVWNLRVRALISDILSDFVTFWHAPGPSSQAASLDVARS